MKKVSRQRRRIAPGMNLSAKRELSGLRIEPPFLKGETSLRRATASAVAVLLIAPVVAFGRGQVTSNVPNAPVKVQQLVFDSEFANGLGTGQWAIGYPPTGNTMNNISLSPSNVGTGQGVLYLNVSSPTTGSLVTTNPTVVKPGFEFGCGYLVEARIYFPGSGDTIDNWPAFWAVGANWPYGGEEDIAEGTGWLSSNYHSDPANESENFAVPGDWANQWITVDLDRQPGENTIYWDGAEVESYRTNDGCASQWLMIDDVVAPDPGSVGEGPYVANAPIMVDYVRVWKTAG